MRHFAQMLQKKIKKVVRRFHTPSPEERALRALYDVFESSPDGSHIIEWRDALNLSTLIKRLRPKRVLELGTGIGASTAIIAHELPQGSTLTTMEQTEKCVTIARALIPQELQKKMLVVYSAPRAFSIPGLSPYLFFSGYGAIPTERGPFDLVFVDGPSGWYENGKFVTLPNGDLITLIPYLAPGCIVYIDGRKSAAERYLRFCADYFSLVSKTKCYTILRRTDVPAPIGAPLHFLDTKGLACMNEYTS